MRGRTGAGWWGVVLEAPDAGALARFYAEVLGWPVVTDEPDWVTIARPGTKSSLSFTTAQGYVPPVWPTAEGRQQMMLHVDVEVDDLDVAVADAEALGATVAQFQPQDDVRVLLDPAGHPFCLYLETTPAAPSADTPAASAGEDGS
jgi:catechol 2,3-dioxygenase-like lactoylglutathione lyase family enzyme